MERQIYLDNAATTYPKPEVVYETMDKYLREECVNAGRGSYELSRKATEMIEETRQLLLSLTNSKYGQVIFSPSATIATNQILRGLNWDNIKNVYVSPFEHNAIMRTVHSLQKEYKFNINVIPFDNITFELNEEKLKVMFAKDNPDVIVLSHVSNVTGYILPIERCHEIAEKYNPINIVDCAQSLGLVPIDIEENFKNCDFIIFAGHKSLYGPFGIAGFIQLNSNINLKEFITGGTGSDSTNLEMPVDHKYEAGSYNTYAISGLNAALKWIKKTKIKEIFKHEKIITNTLINGLKEIDGIELYIPENLENHIGIVSFNIEGFKASDIGMILNEDFNIAVRSGYHCAPYIHKFLDDKKYLGTVRVGIGKFSTKDQIDRLIDAVKELIE
nr:aminotransferase class V-fold PLP-dependent enzyme [Clostridium butyricum]